MKEDNTTEQTHRVVPSVGKSKNCCPPLALPQFDPDVIQF